MERTYIAIDLKTFYASVECVARELDPLRTHLVVADLSRTEKTICLAVTPSLKAYGISGRARLFEVVEKVKEINRARQQQAPGMRFSGASHDATELSDHPEYALEYIVAPPRMAYYIECSTRIYNIYLKYIAPEDIHVYSIDEVFIDASKYLKTYKLTARELAMKMILDVLHTTGVTATAGIGPNLFLCKVAMDIQAKHIQPDENGVRIAELDEMTYRKLFWSHQPLTDFWRVGHGYANRLESQGLYTMGDIARQSVRNEDVLYKLFGVNAELLIDHAWGWEPTTIAQIKAYKPQSSSIGSGQVLQHPYPAEKAKLVMLEMADMLSLDLVDKGMVTDQLILMIGYDIENPDGDDAVQDRYGRRMPKPANGSVNLEKYTASTRIILQAVEKLFDRIVNPDLLIRRMNITANRVVSENSLPKEKPPEELDFFTDYEALEAQQEKEKVQLARERKQQEALIRIKKKFGSNAILKGMNLQEGATAQERNQQIGGHKA